MPSGWDFFRDLVIYAYVFLPTMEQRSFLGLNRVLKEKQACTGERQGLVEGTQDIVYKELEVD